ncbi:MAG TPA: TolC family protein [Burkholderiales bacterium]|jgi:outer membrane protein, heavy metal efflux system|nr:TolC family protein [Burkholderiales bacterium]
MSHRRIAILLAVTTLSATSLRAQEPASALPERLTLPVLLRLVAERSPRLAVEQTAIDTAEAERISAGAFPNPTVSYGRFAPSGGAKTMFDGSQQQQATVDLPLLIGGQRGARIEAAEQGLLATRARVGLAGNELALRAADLFVGLQAAQEKASMLDESVAEVERVVAIVSGRLNSGAASRYDLTRVEVELAGVNARLADARADLADKSAGLAALLGAPGWRPGASGPPVPAGLPTSAAEWRESLISSNPQIIAARREEEAAQAALTRTERERWPVPVLSVGRTWTGDPFGASNFVGLSTEIPLSDARRGLMAKAAADLRAAQRRREAIESEADVELRRLVDGLALRQAALERFRRNVGERVPALKQMAEDAYRLGRGSLLELIDAARSRLDARLTEVDLRAAAVGQELRILGLTGKLGR